jgi:hypothetical protein
MSCLADDSGRTALASLLVDRLAARFHDQILVKAQKGDSQQALRELAMGLDDSLDAEPSATTLHKLQERMQHGDVLYVLDNVCGADELDALLPPGPWPKTTCVIITSSELGMPRSNVWWQVRNSSQPALYFKGI